MHDGQKNNLPSKCFCMMKFDIFLRLKVNGVLRNTKKDLTFVINTEGPFMNVTSGPLSYVYRLYQIKLHYGRQDTPGSEHQIDGKSYSGEVS